MDLFGDALRDHHAGLRGRMLMIRRDDDRVDTHSPSLYFEDEPFAHEADLLARAMGPVLDVGCGAGRTLLWLQARGIEATGIDLSPGAISVADARGCLDVRHGNALTASDGLLPEAAFRTVVLFGNNVGIGGTLEGAGTLFSRLARAAEPGGRLLVTGLNIAKTSDPNHLEYHARNRTRGRPIGELRMRFEYEGAVEDWIPWFHPEPKELVRLAREAGWNVERLLRTGGIFYAAVLVRAPQLP